MGFPDRPRHGGHEHAHARDRLSTHRAHSECSEHSQEHEHDGRTPSQRPRGDRHADVPPFPPHHTTPAHLTRQGQEATSFQHAQIHSISFSHRQHSQGGGGDLRSQRITLTGTLLSHPGGAGSSTTGATAFHRSHRLYDSPAQASGQLKSKPSRVRNVLGDQSRTAARHSPTRTCGHLAAEKIR